MCGAGTSPNAEVFAYAAAQIKKALEITVELGGQGYVFWEVERVTILCSIQIWQKSRIIWHIL